MRRRREWIAVFCTTLVALSSVAARPKQNSKAARPGGTPDAPDWLLKGQPTTAVPGNVSKIAPATRAVSVMVIDARSGEIFYEKNADAPRAAASTQKLLTALIVAERGFLDRPNR
jgi:D-alanyl-D-alanine carboxypeptidase (penicillin-binding protein 5/6)